MPVIAADKLKDYIIRVCQAGGIHPDVAERVADHLVGSNLAGMDSHGVMRLPNYMQLVKAGTIAPDNRIEGGGLVAALAAVE